MGKKRNQDPLDPLDDEPEEVTRSVTAPQPTKKIRKDVHAHDSFEVDIDIDDLEIKSDIADLFADDEPATKELSAFTPPDEPTLQEIVDLSLPATSNEQALPFYVPAGKQTPSPVPRTNTPQATPPPAPSQPDFNDLFDDHVQEGSISKERPPVHDLSELQDSEPSPVDGLPIFAPALRKTPPTSDSNPSKPRFAKGYTAGMQPLDITEFVPEAPKDKKKKVRSRGGRPAPMAGSKKMVRRRFIFTVTVRDIILLLLVLVLAAALWVGWTIYQEFRADKDLARVKSGQEIIDATKAETIKKVEDKKEKDIP
ncbi:MAG: hypothetical protein JRJ87_22315 [Deltaproteobacteria bacterium]|nr:hypothetical protein [Deltaproteobacteria bacterium]